MNGLRNLGDNMKEKIGSGIVVLVSTQGQDKVNVIAMATDDAVAKGAHAGNLIKAVAPIVGGGGGGPITELIEDTSGGSSSPGVSVIPDNPQITVPSTPAYTSVEGMAYKDGSIGTVSIPRLGLNVKVWEGETSTSMAKGLGHYSSTSGWAGNVGMCGHNRGAKYNIGTIKNLKQGDVITYTTIHGTRTYEVTMVKTISNTDWSYLQGTADNRITLTTCVDNQPSQRICVQAVEKSA